MYLFCNFCFYNITYKNIFRKKAKHESLHMQVALLAIKKA